MNDLPAVSPSEAEIICSQILDDRESIPLRVSLAVQLGSVDKAIVIAQLHYWLSKNRRKKDRHRNFRDGHFWSYNTYQDWKEENFPFWSVRKIERIFARLEADGLVVSRQFGGSDRTKWYRINFDRLAHVLQDRSSPHLDEMSGDPAEAAA